MNKNILKLFITTILLVTVSAFSAFAISPYEFTTNTRVNIGVGDYAEPILHLLGNPESSGTTGNNDQAFYYSYSGYTIYTSKTGDSSEVVTGIHVTKSNQKTEEGISVGDSKMKMIIHYGLQYDYNARTLTYTYSRGGSTISFQMNAKDKITLITY